MTRNNDRIRKNSPDAANREIDYRLRETIEHFNGAKKNEISKRIQEIEREWDIERMLQLNASAFAGLGIALGILKNKNWFILPSIVLGFLVQNTIQGWCPPVPLFRRLGLRTRKEIDREKYALKVLRGDFAKFYKEKTSKRKKSEKSNIPAAELP